MRIGQIQWNGRITAAIFEDSGAVRPIADQTVSSLILMWENEGTPVSAIASRLARPAEPGSPLIPIEPAEVWACGCTYQTSASFRDAEHGTREGFYAHVYREPRPEIFFKGTARFCVGPDESIGIRSDSKFTAPEPELALVMGRNGKIMGYTLANDVSAWDIERENPLYLPQSKMYEGCCALGPVIVTADSGIEPYNLSMTCKISRNGKVIFDGSTSTSLLNRKFEQLIDYLYRANPVPSGSVLLTGTGIIVTEESALAAGDVVKIEAPEIGELRNTAEVV